MRKIISILLSVVILNICATVPIAAEKFYDKELYEQALYSAAALGYIDAEPGSDTYGKTFRDNNIKYGFFPNVVLVDMYFRKGICAPESIRNQAYEKYNTSGVLNTSDVYEYFDKVFDIDFNDILQYSDILNPDKSLVVDINDDYITTYVTARHGIWFRDYKIIVDSAIQVKDDIIYFRWHYENSNENKKSEQLYAVLDKAYVAGKEVIAYKYLSLEPPTDEILQSYMYNYSSSAITVTINDEEIWFDQPPIMQNDRTLVPLRAIFEALGAYVEWNDFTQTATAICNGVTIKIAIGDSYLYKNGEAVYLDVPAMLVNDRTLVPVRAISETLGAKVFWDAGSNAVNIMYYPPYSGVTPSEYYYRIQSDIINFGYFIDDNPHYADESSYIYSYNNEDDIDFYIDQYLDCMEGDGFDTAYLKDEDGAEYYLITGKNYIITLINDYLLGHIEIHINKK